MAIARAFAGSGSHRQKRVRHFAGHTVSSVAFSLSLFFFCSYLVLCHIALRMCCSVDEGFPLPQWLSFIRSWGATCASPYFGKPAQSPQSHSRRAHALVSLSGYGTNRPRLGSGSIGICFTSRLHILKSAPWLDVACSKQPYSSSCMKWHNPAPKVRSHGAASHRKSKRRRQGAFKCGLCLLIQGLAGAPTSGTWALTIHDSLEL